MQEQPVAGRVGIVRNVLDAGTVEAAGTTDKAVNLVPLGEQEFGQVRPVLSGNAGDQGTAERAAVGAESGIDSEEMRGRGRLGE